MRTLTLILLALVGAATSATANEKPDTLKVMAWNIWGKLNQQERYAFDGKTARERTIEIIQDSGADVIAMVETYGSASDIAKALGYYHYTPGAKANLCIFSKYKLTDVGTPKGLSSFSYVAATAHLSDTQKVRIYCIWLTSGGRHIVAIKDTALSDADFVKGDNNRAAMIKSFLGHAEVQKYLKNHNEVPVIVAGDLNCVSHLDYTKETAAVKLNFGRVLDNAPTHDALLKLGFIDTYRATNPAITKDTLGYTWTTVGSDFLYTTGKGFLPLGDKKHPRPDKCGSFARIDFVYSLGPGLKPVKSQVISHYRTHTGRSFMEFPSDHAAVLTTFSLEK
jgi:exonuclease III